MLVIVFLSIVTDYALEKLGVFPQSDQGLFTTWMLLLAFVYRTGYGVVGGYVTATFAPALPMRHAITLGIVGTIVSILGLVKSWDMSSHWYPIALIITALPSTWLGGTWKTKQIKK
jgi:hypothetical protein